MKVTDYLRSVSLSVRASSRRSALTSLGIAIGIFAVTMLTSIGEGVRLYLLESFSHFGTNIVSITPGKTTTQGVAGILSTVRPLTIDDAEAMRRINTVQYVIPIVSGTASIESGNRTRATDVVGVSHDAANGWKMNVAIGRFLPDDVASSSRPLCVLGSKLKTELFGNANPLGQTLRVAGHRFRVVGVMESKGQFLGFDLDDMLYIPASRGLKIFNRESLMEINVVYRSGTTSSTVAKRIESLLVDRHGAEDFTLLTQDDMLKALDKILNMLKFAVAALGSITLFVGGIGVMTIMTTALSERSMELGLLRALGATRVQVLALFLGESIITATLGGVLGLGLVITVITVLTLTLPGLPVSLQLNYAILAILLAGLVGIVAGVVPAWRASRLNAIEALRGD